MELVRHLEGETRLLVPRASLGMVPPPTSPVFFNPAASLNRDVTVALTAAAGGESFCDAMAGVGARGVRVAREAGTPAVMVDFNRDAISLAKKSAALNRVSKECAFVVSETSAYLFSRFGRDQRFDFVDLDPFGTPARQLQGGISATADGGIFSVTATDTAVLCGVHPSTCQRRYGSTPVNNEFHHETGIRILIAAIARVASSVDVGVEPVAAHSTRHYMRVYLRIRPGAVKAEASLKGIGRVSWCPACGDARLGEGIDPRCGACSKKVRWAGPLWKGALVDEKLVKAAKKEAGDRGLEGAVQVLGSLPGTDDFPPWSFDIDGICSGLKVPTVPEVLVYGALAEAGRRAMRTPFERTGVKSDAAYADVVQAVKAAAGGRAGDGL